jgi:CubicO group peptidase (beta-lactamase class C family)
MDEELQATVSRTAEERKVPGVAVGVLFDGDEEYAFHGVTSVENPLEVDATTLFQFGSTGKTYTATAIMRLVEQGKVELAASVRTYLPDFAVADADVSHRVTVGHLLNHTAGWEGDMMDDTGWGDDALQQYVARMAELTQVTPLGATVSYNNASLSVAGRILEVLTGTTYEQAIRDLVLDPLGLDHTYFFPNEIMTRRFAAGHTRHDDGTITVARPWALPRGGNPAGGMSATAADQIAWARFHLGDGTAADGTRVLSSESLELMKQPTAEMPGSALGDAVGISWFLRDVDGVRLVGHGGDTIGQHSEFVMVPERGFAFTAMTNCGPNGSELNEELMRWALEHYIGVVDADPEPVLLSDEALRPYTGQYETIAVTCSITAKDGRLEATVHVKPETAAVLKEAGTELSPDELEQTFPLALLAADGDRYVVPDGPAKGMKGYFSRDTDGTIGGVHIGGRLASRVAAVPA